MSSSSALTSPPEIFSPDPLLIKPRLYRGLPSRPTWNSSNPCLDESRMPLEDPELDSPSKVLRSGKTVGAPGKENEKVVLSSRAARYQARENENKPSPAPPVVLEGTPLHISSPPSVPLPTGLPLRIHAQRTRDLSAQMALQRLKEDERARWGDVEEKARRTREEEMRKSEQAEEPGAEEEAKPDERGEKAMEPDVGMGDAVGEDNCLMAAVIEAIPPANDEAPLDPPDDEDDGDDEPHPSSYREAHEASAGGDDEEDEDEEASDERDPSSEPDLDDPQLPPLQYVPYSPQAPPMSPTIPDAIKEILQIPSSELYDEHMNEAGRGWTEKLEVKKEIRQVVRGLNGMGGRFRVVDRLGEGTFSSVYKAIDTLHSRYDNSAWLPDSAPSGSSSSPPSPELEPKDEDITFSDSAVRKGKAKAKQGAGNNGMVFVALKRIYVTSSPERIGNELDIMEELREEDQVIAVMPYHPNNDFRLFYRHLDPPNIRSYLRCLFRALKDVHRKGIVHRDVKPANFLYDYERAEGVLVDFGLAERYQPPSKITCEHLPATPSKPHGSRATPFVVSARTEQAYYDARKLARMPEGKVGFLANDGRPSVKANRAGTRGFRAPEVLMKCTDQTVAIDIWAAGIILLSMLCHKFPIFNSTDDIEALVEIGAVFGRKHLTKCAMLHNRTIVTNIPHMKDDESPNGPQGRLSLSDIILTLNPTLYEPSHSSCTRAEAKEHIESVDQMLDLLKKILHLDPTTRLTAAQALEHQFLREDGADKDEVLWPVGQGVCGEFHEMSAEGKHLATINGVQYEMKWGQGIAIGDEPCEHHRDVAKEA